MPLLSTRNIGKVLEPRRSDEFDEKKRSGRCLGAQCPIYPVRDNTVLEHHLFRVDPDGVIFSDSSAIDDAVSSGVDESGLPRRQYQ
jgi:hypothetical protein